MIKRPVRLSWTGPIEIDMWKRFANIITVLSVRKDTAFELVGAAKNQAVSVEAEGWKRNKNLCAQGGMTQCVKDSRVLSFLNSSHFVYNKMHSFRGSQSMILAKVHSFSLMRRSGSRQPVRAYLPTRAALPSTTLDSYTDFHQAPHVLSRATMAVSLVWPLEH